jgi:hypothetical protein
MTITANTPHSQARVRYFTEKLNNKTREVLARAALPKIDPALVSIAARASRLIDIAEDALSSINNASSNDGREVTFQWQKQRVRIDVAFNILIGDASDSLIRDSQAWYRKNIKRQLDISDIFNGTYPIAPPIEIRLVTRALARVRAKRKPLEDMLELSQQHNLIRQ